MDPCAGCAASASLIENPLCSASLPWRREGSGGIDSAHRSDVFAIRDDVNAYLEASCQLCSCGILGVISEGHQVPSESEKQQNIINKIYDMMFSTFLQKTASIQPGASPVKIVRSLPNEYPGNVSAGCPTDDGRIPSILLSTEVVDEVVDGGNPVIPLNDQL